MPGVLFVLFVCFDCGEKAQIRPVIQNIAFGK
jgi:hypothetical protein